MKLLVTGASGLVGSACVELFTKKGWEVVGIDANMRASFFGTDSKEVATAIDIRNYTGLDLLFFKHHGFDAVIHAAAQPSHDYATTHIFEDFNINALGTLNLLEVIRRYSPNAVFVHVSTDKVYGENMERELIELPTRYHSDYPFNENEGLDFAGKRSLFGCSKTAADLYAQEYANYFDMKVGIFRPGCITGKNHAGAEQHGFLAYLAKCIKEGKTYKIFGYKGKQVRDQIHANDLANAFWHYIMNPKGGAVYNIGGGPERSVSVLEAMHLIEEQLDKKARYELHEVRSGDRQWDVHDVTKFRTDYPEWDYQYSLPDIIKDICEI